MAVSKRLRYEVLKRDNHTCRYCGGKAPDVPLAVDHVVPVALGGSDEPDNLVTACRDCNSGKTSTTASAEVVADVKAVDMKWAGAIKRVAAARGRQRKKRDQYVDRFYDAWHVWHYGHDKKPIPMPSSWQASIERFYELAVPIGEIEDCVRVACGNDRVRVDETFRYFAGCVWRVVKDMQDSAKEMLEGEAINGP